MSTPNSDNRVTIPCVRRLGKEQKGVSLLVVLVMLVILGLGAGVAGQTWRSVMQRDREAELLWRGQQYQHAIESYYSVKHGGQQVYPAKLEDLIKDPRFPNLVKHIRKLYLDPMTGEEWALVKDPAERIMGVSSTSDLEPYKKDGFSKALELLEGKTAYREWEFVYVPPKKKGETSKPSAGQPAAR